MTPFPAAGENLPSVSDQEFKILHALTGALRQGLYGKDILRAVEEEHGKRIAMGTLYVTLGRLVEKGFAERIEGDPTPGTRDLRRQFYRITNRGAQAMAAKRAIFVAGLASGVSR